MAVFTVSSSPARTRVSSRAPMKRPTMAPPQYRLTMRPASCSGMFRMVGLARKLVSRPPMVTSEPT